ncbi:hypothetical protein FAZ19_07270 [Sphingobacterium alkalisoli]|uniref:Uncharacterized protein n=1 Tax=Sphingobacterium alkalisoli TaxID=1874115 RepID=A0A4U0H4S6_9SPHI|nr:DUF6572 domain-containing protein [Sphingobacterium alkalisoli]TJY66711.1 hypothetical protein FAZ19_07270 [Sphingobacterium alkalisoli]GGH14665.1 hypothetical protein GCM10011418_15770 [Sphingobacterium alkalisoli]
MSVENSKVIDTISINQKNVVVLTISDHLEWDDENEHLVLLQDKINAYLEVIESGEIYESYPDAKGKGFQIGIAFKFSPNDTAIDFLEKVEEILAQSGYELDYYHLDNA